MNHKKNSHVTVLSGRENDLFSRIGMFYSSLLPQVLERTKTLESGTATSRFRDWTKRAGAFAGRQPSIHIESGLLERVKRAGLNKFVRQFDKPTAKQFAASLDRAESLMTEKVSFNGDKKKLLAAAHRVSVHCKFPNYKFEPVDLEYALDNQLNKQSSSGFPLYRRKGQVLSEILADATEALYQKSSEIWNYPLTRGFRLQIRKTFDQLDLKLRVMYPYPGAIILLEDSFIMPFVSHFMTNKTFYVIGESGLDISKRIKTAFMHSDVKRITSTDISSFDQNVLNELSILAFGILRSQLKLTKTQHDCFVNIVKYFCTSTAVSKTKGEPSYMFVKTHGVPSGSGFTNMIDSIVHAIALEYACPGILSTDRVNICGDDNIFDSTQVDFDHMVNIFEKELHLPITVEKSEHYKSWKKVKFLGFTWIDGCRYQDTLLLINQLLWHADFRTDLDVYERELARGASVLLNAVNGQDLFRRIFPDIIEVMSQGVDVRFFYLYGTQPPTTLPGVFGFTKPKGKEIMLPHSTASLRLHLSEGWKIR